MAPTISQDIIEFYIVSKIDETGEVNGRIKKCYAKKSHFSSARKKKLIRIWMSTNKKPVFWHLDQFLCGDMTKKGDFLAKEFFSMWYIS